MHAYGTYSGVSRLQRLVGPIVLRGQTFLDACQNHISIRKEGSGYVRLAYKV